MTAPSYPGYPGAAPAPKARPTIVTVATYLLFLVAFLELVDAIIGFSTYPKISDAIKDAYAGTRVEGAEDIVAASSVIGAVINLLFAAGLTVLGILDGRGRNVARIITWVVGGLSLCCIGGGLGSSALVSSVNSSDSSSAGGPSSAELQEKINAALTPAPPGALDGPRHGERHDGQEAEAEPAGPWIEEALANFAR